MTLEWSFVPAHTIFAEIAPNIARHYAEMSEGDDYGCPNIDWDYYLQASMSGQCVAVTLRDKGHLVGYNILTISTNPRYKHLVEASGNGLFVERPYRGRYGILLIKKAEEYLKTHEINYCIGGERFSKLLTRLGYKTTYKIWSKNGQ